MPDDTTEFGKLLERMDLGEIDRLREAKQAITYLEGQRQLLQEQIATIDGQIGQVKAGTLDPGKVLPKAVGAERQAARQVVDAAADVPATAGKSARRPYQRRTGTLREKIIEVLRAKNAPLAIADIAQAVTAGGYESAGQNLTLQVAMTLSKMDELERVARGIYQLKPAG